MKIANYLGLSALIFFGSVFPANNRRLDHKNVITKSVVIKQMITHHNYAANALMVLGSLQAASVFLPMFMSAVNVFIGKPYNASANTIDVGSEDKPERVAFFAALSSATKDIFYTKEGWKVVVFPFIGQAVCSFLLQKINEEFFHPNTLRWYIFSKVPYVQTIRIIKKLAKQLEVQAIDEHTMRHYHDSLVSACYQLVGYGEDICAYMLYKSGELEGEEKLAAERVARYFFNYNNDILGKIFDQLDVENPKYHMINDLIATYEAELKFQLKHFTSIEGE